MKKGGGRVMGILRWLYWTLRSDRGVTTTEYALLLALIVVMLIGTLSALGGALENKLHEIITQIEGV